MNFLKRRDAVDALLRDRGDMLVIAGLGSPVYDVFAAGDDRLNFYNWGAMGSAAMVGLGLARARPDRPVVVFTGDGEMLMGMGAFATIAQHQPRNLSIFVLDNEQYAETGMQDTATSFGADLAAVAMASGLKDARTYREFTDLEALRDRIHVCSGTLVAILKIERGDVPRTIPIRDGVENKHRFLQAIDYDVDRRI